MKNKTITILIAILSFGGTTAFAQGSFNSMVSNPFVFCSSPKPCKRCQPLRRIYEQICPAGDANKFPNALNSAANSPALEDAKKLEQQVQNSPGLVQAVDLNNQAHQKLGIVKPIPLHRNDLRDKGYENIIIENQTFQVLKDQGYELQVLQAPTGQTYQNKNITDTIYEYNGQRFTSKNQLISYIQQQIKDQNGGYGSSNFR
ncbi:hypothetical protein GW796_10595 [archaeon]|nr:hypothetical protein [archaeon]